MKHIEILKKYKEIKNYCKLKEELKKVLKIIYENNIDYKYNILLIDEINNQIEFLENLIYKKRKKYKLENINLTLDDILILSSIK